MYARLSVASSPSLAQAWSDLVRTRRAFGKRSWLASTSSAWLRSTELTLNRGMWHAHDNVLILGTPEQLQEASEGIATKWATAAAQKGVEASPGAQYVRPSDSTGAVRHYMLKRLMGRSSVSTPGQTPGDIWADLSKGDADAIEPWEELEKYFSRRAPGNLHSYSATLYGTRERAGHVS